VTRPAGDVLASAGSRAQDVVVLAHGGGAPEAAMVGLPLLVLVVFAVLERRARRREREQDREQHSEQHPEG
jgi:membrane protein implicated in regulation of membrane protease activity